MAFIDENGRVLRPEDAAQVINMLDNSIRNQGVALAHLVDFDDQLLNNPDFDAVKEAYRQAHQNAIQRLQQLASSKKKYNIEDILLHEQERINAEIVKKVGKDRATNRNVADFLRMMGDPNHQARALHVKDTVEGYKKTDSAFKLADKPMAGVEDLQEYEPNSGRVVYLTQERQGNSGTLEVNVAELQKQLEKETDEFVKKNIEKAIREKVRGDFGFRSGAEMARIKSAELQKKKVYGFADIYDAYSAINRLVRAGDENGGQLRNEGVQAGHILGINPINIPDRLYRTLSTIADAMNEIKATEDPNLKKTRAIQLAAYAYQMTLSEHIFLDGNGRTSRLFADTILQTFGLLPHTPSEAEKHIVTTIGGELDFNKGAEVFLEGIQHSQEAYNKYLDEHPEEKPVFTNNDSKPEGYGVSGAKEKKEAPAGGMKEVEKEPVQEQKQPENKPGMNEAEEDIIGDVQPEALNVSIAAEESAEKNAEPKKSMGRIIVEQMNELTAEQFNRLQFDADDAVGMFRDSDQYKRFQMLTSVCASVAHAIVVAKRTNSKVAKVVMNTSEAEKFIKPVLKNSGLKETMNINNAGTLLKVCFDEMQKSARTYIDYKMKDHTFDRTLEPNKKMLNDDDLGKLKVVGSVLTKLEYDRMVAVKETAVQHENTQKKGPAPKEIKI